MRIFKFLFFICFALCIISCEKDDKNEKGNYTNGVIIANEGNFQSSNASISFFSFETNTVTNNVFMQSNGRTPGDVLQSYCKAGDYGFLVMNNSKTIEIVNAVTFEVATSPIEASYPRHMLQIDDNKVYLSNGNYNGNVYVIDLNSLSISDSVAVGNGPERMAKSGNKVFVANSGGWLADSTVSVIDAASDELLQTIVTGDMPVDIVVDKNNMVWVLCNGNTIYDYTTYDIIGQTNGKLVQLNPDTYEITKSIDLGSTGDAVNPMKIEINPDGDILYVAHADGIYKMDISSDQLPADYFIALSTYGFNVNPENGDLYVLQSPSFTGAGIMTVFDESGTEIISEEVGISPNGAFFQ